MLKAHLKDGLNRPSTTGFSKDNLKLMQTSFDTYWPILEKSSLIPMIIDPRYKLSYITDKTRLTSAKGELNVIFTKYEERIETNQDTSNVSSNPSSSKTKSSATSSIALNKAKDKVLTLAQRFFVQSSSTSSEKDSKKSELTLYLSEPRISNSEEDILLWWKTNQASFPVLSKIARDYLAAQASSLPSERGFSRSGLTITNLRNRLHSETVRYLMCLQSWLKLKLD